MAAAESRRALAVRAIAVFVAVVAATTLFRLVLPDDLGANESTDLTTVYLPVAERLLDGEGLTTPDGAPALRYPPGYPVLLAAASAATDPLGLDPQQAATALALLSTGSAGVVLWALSRRAFDERVALVAVGVWCLHPVHLWLAKQPNSELPYEVLLYGAVLASTPALRSQASLRSAASAGGLLALATLVRPSALALLPALAAALWLLERDRPRRGRAARAGALVGTFVLVLAPWTWWASTQAGQVVLVADAFEVNVVEGLSLGIDSRADADGLLVPDGARGLAVDTWEQEGDLQDGAALREHVGEQARDEPGAMAQLLGVKLARSWYANEAGRWEALVVLVQAAGAIVVGAGAVLAWRAGGPARRYVALASALVLAGWASTVLVHSLLRHQAPTLGLLAPLAALALVSLLPATRAEKAMSTQT